MKPHKPAYVGWQRTSRGWQPILQATSEAEAWRRVAHLGPEEVTVLPAGQRPERPRAELRRLRAENEDLRRRIRAMAPAGIN